MVLKELYFQKTNADKHKKNKRYVHIENKNNKQFKSTQDEKKVLTSIKYKEVYYTLFYKLLLDWQLLRS